ncbi:MAG: CapA family protein [Clostridia bacterium]|nr:CapA family protein [Clostridia bacterium]
MLPNMSFTATGDTIIGKRLTQYDGFSEIQDEIRRGDMRFFNLETTIHDYESYASQFSGGGWLCAPRETLNDCKEFGFNIASFANNHSLDFAYKGFEKTLENIRAAGLPCAGAGLNLEQASSPVYLDCPQGRIALIALTTSFHPSAIAGEQTRSLPGRPGVNGVRYHTVYHLEPRYLEMAKALAEVSGANDVRDFLRKEGYLPPLAEGRVELDQLTFTEDEQNHAVTVCNKQDVARVERAIYEAQLQADYIVISLHSHELQGADIATPPAFIEALSRLCINSGAHAVIGHGPHVLRPVELYKGYPIFYSLGDFIFHNENMTKVPAEFCTTVGLDANSSVRDVLSARSREFTVGWQSNPEAFQTVIPYWEMEDGKLTKLEFLAAELNFEAPRSRSGWPKPAANSAILDRLAQMSRPYGTEMQIEGNRAKVILESVYARA